MRRHPNSTITPQMYRHFAMVTLVMTALMAFFADGESRKAVAAAPSVERHLPTPLPASQMSQPDIDSEAGPGSWGSDEGETDQQPKFGSYTGPSAPVSNPFGLSRSRHLSPGPPPIESQDDTKSPSPRPTAPTAAQIEAAADASRVRSGAAGND